MGQFEKIVVLLAFFLVTLILVVTFRGDGEEGVKVFSMNQDQVASSETDAGGAETAEAASLGSLLAEDRSGEGSNARSRNDVRGGPFNAQPVVPDLSEQPAEEPEGLVGRSLQDSVEAERRSQAEQEADLFLDDSFSVRPTSPAMLPQGSALVSVAGLRRTWNDSIMEYTWQRNDSWTSLAQRLYADDGMSELLRQFNEGSTYVAPGTPVLIPVYDRREQSTTAQNEPDAENVPREELSEERGTLYKVVDGDSLWVISKKVYGKGHMWERIYKANTDLLESPEAVKPGMGLRIP